MGTPCTASRLVLPPAACGWNTRGTPPGLLGEIRAGRAEMAFPVPAVPVEEILQKAREGYRFPRKTTYFYPKVPPPA